jgi:site-specific DNA-methyltransferase (adenine-specific)
VSGLHAHKGDGVDIYPTLPADAFTLIVSDGAYGIGGFPGDPKSPKALADWYAPHLAAWDRLAAPSSSLYFWCTPEGCARMLSHLEAAGWRLYSCIRWDKGTSQMAEMNHGTVRGWVNSSEDCYFYVREVVDISAMAAETIYRDLDAKRRDSSAPVHMRAERESAGVTRRQVAAYFPSASGGLTGCVTNWEEGYNFPTWDIWQRFAAALQDLAPRTDPRPYLVTAAVWERLGSLRESYEALRGEYEALRGEYEALRYPFALPQGVTDVWAGLPVNRPGRHGCAKRDDHIERIVKASSRPGDRVLEPFGGGAPVLRACRKLGRSCDSIERDPEWHARALAGIEARPDLTATNTQPSLWGTV